ncbi:MAG: class I SAM-dependent methyltransferase [Hyphomicrobium sp.]
MRCRAEAPLGENSLATPAIRIYRRYKIFVSPRQYLLRRSIARFGKWYVTSSPLGLCLDVGAGTSPYRQTVLESFKVNCYWSLDLVPSDTTDIVADAGALPLANDSVDLVVCIDTIQHLRDYSLVLDELVRVTAPGGLLLIAFPFIYGECDVQDFRRWTLLGMTDELERRGCTVVKMEPSGGAVTATLASWRSAINNLVPGGRKSWRAQRSVRSYLREGSLLVLGLPLTILTWVAIVLDGILPQAGLYTGGVGLAKVGGNRAKDDP